MFDILQVWVPEKPALIFFVYILSAMVLRGLALLFSVLIIGCSLFNYISFSPFVPTKGAKFVPASGSKLACTRNERKLGCTRHNASLLAVSNMSCCKVFGANYLAFSQFGYIFYVLSMPIESTKELCAYGRFLNGKRSWFFGGSGNVRYCVVRNLTAYRTTSSLFLQKSWRSFS